jgi:programmed cell death protein 5
VKNEKAMGVENMIVSMAMAGKLPGRINEGKLIEMLEGIGARKNQGASINIQRKKYAFDSDDDDDNDDDLL